MGNDDKKYTRGKNPNSLKNLEKGMAKPGDVLNPFGKAPGTKDRATGLKKWLELNIKFENITEGGAKIFESLPNELNITVEDSIDFALIAEAKDGNINAIREIKDTLYGKIVDKQEHSGPDGKPIETKSTFILDFGGNDDNSGTNQD